MLSYACNVYLLCIWALNRFNALSCKLFAPLEGGPVCAEVWLGGGVIIARHRCQRWKRYTRRYLDFAVPLFWLKVGKTLLLKGGHTLRW